MRLQDLILRCYAMKDGNAWVAVCIDLCLSAQGDDFNQAKAALDAQIKDYLYDALEGEDKPFAAQLLMRKAPIMQRLQYHWIKTAINLHLIRDGLYRLIDETLPVSTAH